MDAVLARIEPYHPTVGPKGSRPPMPQKTVLRVQVLQSGYVLNDPMAE